MELKNLMLEKINKDSYQAQLREKIDMLSALMLPMYDAQIDVFESPAKHYRMRAEFRVWHRGEDTFHIMFNQQTKEKYRVDQLPSASVLINHAMTSVIDYVKCSNAMRTKLFQIDYLSSTSNEIVISLIYHKKLDETWIAAAKVLQENLSSLGKVNIIGRAKKQKIVLGNDFVEECLVIKGDLYRFKQIENSFTQPNAHINIKMIEWVIDHAANKNEDLLELYCGAGNFSIPLSRYFNSVLATEISKTSVAAAQDNIKLNNAENLRIARLSSEEFVQAFNQERKFNRLIDINIDDYHFSTVLVDPPRAGLDDATIDLINKFENIVYISCNPQTLYTNLEKLCRSHDVVKMALFDQFPFTKHVETGVILQKREAIS